ncbi:MAG: deoxyribonuclease IV [Thermoleophilia bacterium]
MDRRLGIHLRTGGGLLAAARHAREIGCTTFQIMSGNPSAWNPGRLDPVKAAEFAAYTREHDLPVFLHAGYLINLSCRSGPNTLIHARSVKLLQANIGRARALGCEQVVFHPGSRRGVSAGESQAALLDGIGSMDAGGVVLLLENGAGSGDTACSRFEELGQVLDAAAARGIAAPLGVCLDTAHLWGAGYDLTSAAAARRLVDDFDRIVGIGRLRLIHLNDSPLERGSRRDRHEHLGCGQISPAALTALARHPRLREVPLIMETPGASSPSDGQRMRDLCELAG